MAMEDSYDRRMQIDAYFASLGRGMSFFALFVILLVIIIIIIELIAVIIDTALHIFHLFIQPAFLFIVYSSQATSAMV